MNDSVFGQKLKSVMSDNKFDRKVRVERGPRLAMRHLAKAATGDKRMMLAKRERKGKEWSVVLLLDESGSMYSYGRHDPATDATMFLAERLEKAGIAFSVLGFNCEVRTHKGFGDKLDAPNLRKEIEYQMNYGKHKTKKGKDGSMYLAAGGNHDYDALAAGFDALEKRKHGRLLLYLTDGHPNCDKPRWCGYDEKKHEASEIKKLIHERTKQAVAVGIGIQTEGILPLVMEERIEISNLEDLKPGLIGILEKNIRRG